MSDALPSLVLLILVQPTVPLAAAWAASALMARTSAAARHAVWTTGILAALAIPLIGFLAPVRIPALDRVVSAVPAAASRPELHLPARLPVSGEDQIASLPAPGSEAGGPSLALLLALVWLSGFAVLAARIVVGRSAMRRLIRRSEAVENPALAAMFAGQLSRNGLGPRPTLRLSRDTATPAVFGLRRPVIVVPAEIERWSSLEIEAALSHELAHVLRRDAIVDLAALLMRALYWCNPLVWVASRRLVLERERSCDDRVLRTGANPDHYAGFLLAVARSAARRRLPAGAAAMARPGELESRLLAVLDPGLRREPVSRSMPMACAAAAILLGTPVSALRVTSAPVTLSAAPLSASEPDQQLDSLTHPWSERVPSRVAASPEEIDALLRGPDGALARRLIAATGQPAKHAGDLVAERARWALGLARDGKLIEPLLAELSGPDWRTQAYAAWVLALAPDARAVPLLVPMLRHPVWRLRAMAAASLGASRDPRARPAMEAALADPAWQVRIEAIGYLHATLGDASRAILTPLLGDRHIAVRIATSQALATH